MASVETLLPPKGEGFVTYSRGRDGLDQYGTRETIDALLRIARAWRHKYPGSPSIQIGDISRKGGGKFPYHAGTHTNGRDVDFLPIRQDKTLRPVFYHQKAYSRELTGALMRLIRSEAKVVHIFFNDPELIAAGLCKGMNGHDNYFHVRFADPNGAASGRDTGAAGIDLNTPDNSEQAKRLADYAGRKAGELTPMRLDVAPGGEGWISEKVKEVMSAKEKAPDPKDVKGAVLEVLREFDPQTFKVLLDPPKTGSRTSSFAVAGALIAVPPLLSILIAVFALRGWIPKDIAPEVRSLLIELFVGLLIAFIPGAAVAWNYVSSRGRLSLEKQKSTAAIALEGFRAIVGSRLPQAPAAGAAVAEKGGIALSIHPPAPDPRTNPNTQEGDDNGKS